MSFSHPQNKANPHTQSTSTYRAPFKRGEDSKFHQNYKGPNRGGNTYDRTDYDGYYYDDRSISSQKSFQGKPLHPTRSDKYEYENNSNNYYESKKQKSTPEFMENSNKNYSSYYEKQNSSESRKKNDRGVQRNRKDYDQGGVYQPKNSTGKEVLYFAKKGQKQDIASEISNKDETKTDDQTPISEVPQSPSITQENKSTDQQSEEPVAKTSTEIDASPKSDEAAKEQISGDAEASQKDSGASSYMNEPDVVSTPASKPTIIVPEPSIKSGEEDKDSLSAVSDSETIQSKQTTTTTQNMQPQFFYPQMPQLPNMFQAPYIVFPQPNGTMVIQPIYQFPMINMPSQGSGGDEQSRQSQPYYLIPSNLVQPDAARTMASPTMAPMAPQFMPFNPFYPGFMMNPLMANTMPLQQTYVGERDNIKANISESQGKDENLSDRRDD